MSNRIALTILISVNAIIAGLPLFGVINVIIWGYTGYSLTPEGWWSDARAAVALAMGLLYIPVIYVSGFIIANILDTE